MFRKYSRGGEGVTSENDVYNRINPHSRLRVEEKASEEYMESHKVEVVWSLSLSLSKII
jgi:hypothetical protein